ncbi:hypothetical protein [Methylobacterium sp. WL19]|uniref:hypothetical protein n=1 Tax=Methylobacterium sp. WL19 TaxID=2603896 RepID=UPI0011C89F4D|nr:hypothetical protein [Methylobacterium sp. WL19]TXN33536.1 hypothetical protein FV220_02015 [Methylobacterium sp. WL19]
MRSLGLVAIGLLIGIGVYHVLVVTGVGFLYEHFHPIFAEPHLRVLAAEENRKALEVVFGTIIAVGGITLTCTVGYLALPQERFGDSAQRFAAEAFGKIFVDRQDYQQQLGRASAAIEKDEKSRPSLLAFHTLITIQPAAPWNFNPCTKQILALGGGPRLLWRGRRIALFARASDVVFVAWLAGLSALAVAFAAYHLVRHGALDPATDGPWPWITDFAQVAGFFTLAALISVMAVAITRAVTALSVRRAIEEAREQEEGRLADEASGQMLEAAKALEA